MAVREAGVPTNAGLVFARLVRPIVRVAHRATLDGLEHLPPSGPFLLVANHSGALGISEIGCFLSLYAARFGRSRPLAGFAHPFAFMMWPASWVLRQLGAVPSTYAAAEGALAAGVPILVFPGGDHEVMRPIWQANRVDFAARLGFLRIARKAWVPVVPMGIRGGHLTAPPLFRSPLFPYLFLWPRLANAKRFGLTLLGALGAAMILWLVPAAWPWRLLLAWAWAASPLAMIPWVPWRVRIRIGSAIAPEALFGKESDDGTLAKALSTVQDAVQALVAP